MKQHELEAFVGRLAEAEKKAAAAIKQAENDEQLHLQQLEQELKQWSGSWRGLRADEHCALDENKDSRATAKGYR
jgi:hypothetical protein